MRGFYAWLLDRPDQGLLLDANNPLEAAREYAIAKDVRDHVVCVGHVADQGTASSVVLSPYVATFRVRRGASCTTIERVKGIPLGLVDGITIGPTAIGPTG